MISPPKEEWQSNGLIRHNLPRPDGLLEAEHLLDIGAGIRPMNWYRPVTHLCVEPYKPYCKILKKAGFKVNKSPALEFLKNCNYKVDAIYLLDVIEHMEKHKGYEVIKLAKKIARDQIVVFTPFGFMEQEGDAWGLGGDYWQTHRSGWLPQDFKGWQTRRYAKGFFAIWTNTHS